MSNSSLPYTPISQLATRIRAGELSPVALTEALLGRIEALDSTLHAFIEVTAERALAEARAAELAIQGGQYLGPLHGIPYVAKDLFDVRGRATRAGTRLLAHRIAAQDCHVVHRLAAAGMVLLGKTHTVQFAFGGVGINHDLGTPHNPWKEQAYAPGGSSSGTAVAVAAGMAPMGLGSDTGGSVRIPAALCGLAGLKTTVGRVSRAGVYPLSWSLDSVGPLARSVQDCALVYAAIQGPDPADETTHGQQPHDVLSAIGRGVEGLNICFAETAFWDGADPAVTKAVRDSGEVFARLGARVGSVPLDEAGQVMGGERERHRAMMVAAEACAVNRELLDHHFDELDPSVARRMIGGRSLSAPDYFETMRAWMGLRASAVQSLTDVDAVIVPTCPVTARPIDLIDQNEDTYAQWNGMYLRNTAIGNMLNLCGVSVPCGFDPDGLPIGLSVLAKPFQEDVALRVALAFELATEWSGERPNLGWVTNLRA